MKRTFVIGVILLLIANNTAFSHSDKDLIYFLYAFTNLSYKQSHTINNRAGLHNVSLGMKYDINHKKETISDSITKVSSKYDIEVLKFGLTKKFYDDKSYSNLDFDFSLLKAEMYSNVMNNFFVDFGMSLIDKDTKLYSKNDYDFISQKLAVGYDLSIPKSNLFIYPTVFIKYGARLLELDTFINPEFSFVEDDKQWNFIDLGVNFYLQYKDFSLKYEFCSNVISAGKINTNKLELKYGLSNEFYNLLSIYVNYENNFFDIYKNENSLEKDLSYRMQSINFGINIHPINIFTNTMYNY